MPDERRPAHEKRDFDLKLIARVAIGWPLFALIAGLGLAGLLGLYMRLGGTAGQLTTPPKLQWLRETQEREAATAKAQRRAESYGWVDRRAGTVHLPVERAMALVAQRGIRWDLHDLLPGPQQVPPKQAPAEAARAVAGR